MKSLRALNPNLPMYHVTESRFALYGRVLTGYDFRPWIDYLEHSTKIPETGNVYIPSEAGLEALNPFAEVQSTLFAGLPMQVGYCNGNGSLLNGMEYHKAIEILVAQTDLVLLLADYGQMTNFTLDVASVDAIFVPAGTAIELKPTALHLAPCRVSDAGFKSAIVLPDGTNTDLPSDCHIQKNDPESRILFKKGKWMLAHPDNQLALSRGAVAAIVGENLQVRYK